MHGRFGDPRQHVHGRVVGGFPVVGDPRRHVHGRFVGGYSLGNGG